MSKKEDAVLAELFAAEDAVDAGPLHREDELQAALSRGIEEAATWRERITAMKTEIAEIRVAAETLQAAQSDLYQDLEPAQQLGDGAGAALRSQSEELEALLTDLDRAQDAFADLLLFRLK